MSEESRTTTHVESRSRAQLRNFIIQSSTLLEIALYGAGLWNLMYLYVWPIVVLAALPFRRSESRAFWAAIAGLHGLCFGALCAIPYFFIGGWQMAFSWWVSGIPYDVIHCVSNTVLVFVLFPPLRRALERAKKTSGGRE